ncbi:cupin domain-containing protein [Sneathiella aquimaris]|uniref:cupin domain-containing protein n=1 Tax=Sneathiella aquimaris TaxID=2599305 RepID=UPI00146AB48D|nr:cupin domain-containing protein [Sneathiella aquimaris]
MQVNADFNTVAIEHGGALDWVPSPIKGVHRRMLDRVGGEVARATTIVHFDANSQFDAHTHGGGEEFLVLEGVFQDEHGDYPVGTYIRNPPTSRHTPRSDEGCVILVKLWQFQADDRAFTVVDTEKMELFGDPLRENVRIKPLFQDAFETVRLEYWTEASSIRVGDDGGAEVFVLNNQFDYEGQTFSPYSWLRLPPGKKVDIQTGEKPVRVWTKTGHLTKITVPE